MRHQPLAVWCVPLLAAMLRHQESRDAAREKSILDLHIASLGGAKAISNAGDLEYEGTYETGIVRSRWHAYVRRAPFAYREEYEFADGRKWILITDGENAWSPCVGGPGIPLPSNVAFGFMESGFLLGFQYTDGTRTRASSPPNDTDSLPEWPGLPPEFERGVSCDGLAIFTSAETRWMFAFDRRDGRMLGGDEHNDAPGFRWVQFANWKTWDGLSVPSMRATGYSPTGLMQILRIEQLRTRRQHPPDLFRGKPIPPPLPALLDVSPLNIALRTEPSSAMFWIPHVRVNDRLSAAAVLDTGCASLALDPRWAQSAAVPVLGSSAVRSYTGGTIVQDIWIDAFEMGPIRRTQLRGMIAPLPPIADLARDEAPGVVLGGKLLAEGSPIFDLAGGKLLFRGKPFTPLKSLDGAGEVVAVPLIVRESADTTYYDVDVLPAGATAPARVVLDTGAPTVLRLTGRGLAAAGLSTNREDWIKRGAVPVNVVGLGGQTGQDLLIQLESVRLGSVEFKHPWVGLTEFDAPADPRHPGFHGMLGAGALLPFKRVGLDVRGSTLELEAGPTVVKTSDGVFQVPAPGVWLGFSMRAHDASRTNSAPALPVINNVSAGSPAARGGVRSGDELVSIDGTPTAMMSHSDICRRLWVMPGRRVSLTFRRAAGDYAVTLP